jgi:hypothetical protein
MRRKTIFSHMKYLDACIFVDDAFAGLAARLAGGATERPWYNVAVGSYDSLHLT